MRTLIKTDYSDISAFLETYPRFKAEFEKDENANKHAIFTEHDHLRAHAFLCKECGHEYYALFRNRHVTVRRNQFVEDALKSFNSDISNRIYDRKCAEWEEYLKIEKHYEKYACAHDKDWAIKEAYPEFINSEKTACPLCGAKWEESPPDLRNLL